MNKTILCILTVVLANFLFMTKSNAQFIFPNTKARPVVDEVHGYKLTDNYRWLEDKKDPEVIKWTKAQHDATLNYINGTYPEVEGLREELTAYIDRDVISPMQLVADRQFFTVKKKGELQSKLYTRLDGKDILVFDPIKIDPSGKSAMSGRSYTKKGDKLAIGIQSKGAEIQTYYIIDTKTGKQIGEPIEGLRGFSWTADEKHAYINVRTQEMIDNQEANKTYLHQLGSPRSEDKFIIQPKDAKNFASVYDTRRSDLTFYSEGDFYATHSLRMKKTGSTDEPVEIYAHQKHRAYPNAIDDKIYFYTNHEAPNFKLMIADKANPSFENWKALYTEKETVLESYSITPKYLIIQDKKDVQSRILLHSLDGKFIKEIKLPEVGNINWVSYNYDVKKVYVGMSSFTTPFKIFELNPDDLASDNLKWNLFYEQKTPLNTTEIEGKIKFYQSKDGTKVPIFIIHKKGLELDGTNPTLLYGYGGFNIGIKPSFVGAWTSFINRGGIFVQAGIRGGDEYGESWHEDGMLLKKQNTFDDFISAGEYLIKEGYTNTDKLCVYGGSNGGLLIGAVLNQRPDLFQSAICAVPLLDMVRYHKFLIARYWIPEYGDPDVKVDFQNIFQYSPYHNIRVGADYPTTMVTAGENDTRVDPLHAKKFVATIQNNIGQENPFMLYINFDSGHGSGKSTQQQIDDLEFRMRFVMGTLGMME